MEAITYKQRLLEEIDSLSEQDLERIYKLLALIRVEFLEAGDKARYYTESWIQAEREATEAYQQGALEAFDGVDEMMDAILAEREE